MDDMKIIKRSLIATVATTTFSTAVASTAFAAPKGGDASDSIDSASVAVANHLGGQVVTTEDGHLVNVGGEWVKVLDAQQESEILDELRSSNSCKEISDPAAGVGTDAGQPTTRQSLGVGGQAKDPLSFICNTRHGRGGGAGVSGLGSARGRVSNNNNHSGRFLDAVCGSADAPQGVEFPTYDDDPDAGVGGGSDADAGNRNPDSGPNNPDGGTSNSGSGTNSTGSNNNAASSGITPYTGPYWWVPQVLAPEEKSYDPPDPNENPYAPISQDNAEATAEWIENGDDGEADGAAVATLRTVLGWPVIGYRTLWSWGADELSSGGDAGTLYTSARERQVRLATERKAAEAARKRQIHRSPSADGRLGTSGATGLGAFCSLRGTSKSASWVSLDPSDPRTWSTEKCTNPFVSPTAGSSNASGGNPLACAPQAQPSQAFQDKESAVAAALARAGTNDGWVDQDPNVNNRFSNGSGWINATCQPSADTLCAS